jgi:hypothetical protein
VEVFRDKLKLVEVPRETIKLVEVTRDKIIHSSAERNLFNSLIKRNALLVQTSQAKQRLETLLDMADDCRQHVLTLLEQGPREHLPLTINLYGRLLREGVLVQLTRLPEEMRPEVGKTVRHRLEAMAAFPPGAKKTLPKTLEDQQNALQQATRQAIDLLDQPEAISAQKVKYHRTEPLHPSTTLVLFAITASNESDPVAMADVCAECIHQLMPCVLLSLADEANPHQTELGQQFGELIRHGIYAPLATATANDSSPQMTDKAERILERTTQAVDVMEKNLQQAPAAERIGLQRAIETTKKGWDKHW